MHSNGLWHGGRRSAGEPRLLGSNSCFPAGQFVADNRYISFLIAVQQDLGGAVSCWKQWCFSTHTPQVPYLLFAWIWVGCSFCSAVGDSTPLTNNTECGGDSEDNKNSAFLRTTKTVIGVLTGLVEMSEKVVTASNRVVQSYAASAAFSIVRMWGIFWRLNTIFRQWCGCKMIFKKKTTHLFLSNLIAVRCKIFSRV